MTSEQQKLEDVKRERSLDREWHNKKLGEVAHINLGQSPKGEYYNEEGDGPHFIQGSKNFGNKYPGLERFCSQPKREAEEGDVLISVRAPVGPVNIAPEDLCIGRGVTALKMDDGSNEYLYYYLKYFEDKWSQYADGTTFNSITKSDLQNLEIPYPPVEEQKKISRLLYQIDFKIEINSRINDILEEMSRALFKSKFIDFDESKELEDSDLGKIPKEYDVKYLSEIAEIEMGSSPDSKYYNESGDGLPFFQGNKNFSDIYPKIKRWCSNPGKVAEERDVIMTVRAPVGEINKLQEKSCIGRGVAAFRSKSFDSNEYIYYLLKSRKERWNQFASGTTYESVNSTDVKNFPFVCPTEEDRREFIDAVKPMANIIENKFYENKHLEELRDTLLPKLISGEVRVNDIELDELEVDSEV